MENIFVTLYGVPNILSLLQVVSLGRCLKDNVLLYVLCFSLLHLWNLSLHLYIEKIHQGIFLDFILRYIYICVFIFDTLIRLTDFNSDIQ